MKSKIMLFSSAVLILTAVLVSCASTGGGGGGGDADTDKQFSSIYETHKQTLDLTNATQYTVKKGDRLSKIAATSYGSVENAYYFPLIMVASSDVVLDPDRIEPGMKLTIPELQRNIDDPAERTNVKSLLKDVAALYKRDGNKYPETQAGLIKLSDSL
ncbi:hypothetical protein FACS1894190_04760 [Spirochaetia bacterium]|nr:hypothetical protein FACS1894190_04760 [Spirochaetia bacterium]